MKTARFNHAIINVGEFVYVFGGCNNGAIKECERLNANQKAWQKIASMQVPRECCSAALIKGNIYIAGGADLIETYNIAANRFSILKLNFPDLFRCLIVPLQHQLHIFGNKRVIKVDPVNLTQENLFDLSEDE